MWEYQRGIIQNNSGYDTLPLSTLSRPPPSLSYYLIPFPASLPPSFPGQREREFFIDNLLVRIHFIIVMIRWTGLAPWEFEFSFPGSLTSKFSLGRTWGRGGLVRGVYLCLSLVGLTNLVRPGCFSIQQYRALNHEGAAAGLK